METRTILIAIAAFILGALGFMMLGGSGMTSGSCTFTVEDATQLQNPVACVETNMGTFEILLYLDKTPITAGNFIELAESGFYDGLIFHRIIDGFVIQGGDPEGTGAGGPGYSIVRELHPELKHIIAGTVAMARSEEPDSAGSQFYVTLAPTPFLDIIREDGRDSKYAVFGRVVKGLEVVLEIGHVETGDLNRPAKDVVMNKVTIYHPDPPAEEEEEE